MERSNKYEKKRKKNTERGVLRKRCKGRASMVIKDVSVRMEVARKE